MAKALSQPVSLTNASTIADSSYSCLSVFVADSTIRNITITNANSGGAFSENSYVPTNIIKLDEGVHYGIDYDTYTTEWMNGYTKSNTLSDSSKIAEYLATPGDATTDKDGKTYAVKAKYIAPSIWFKLSEIKALLANLNASSSEEVQAIKSIDKILLNFIYNSHLSELLDKHF